MVLTYLPYDAEEVASLRAGGPDAYGNPAERAISDGIGKPCRSCLNDVPAGAQMLICAARPFGHLQPYAETGPVFFCADDCTPHHGHALPPVLRKSPDYLVKAYDQTDRIMYGRGRSPRRIRSRIMRPPCWTGLMWLMLMFGQPGTTVF